MAPRVLIADKLSPTAVQIFKDRGIETDVKTGLDRDALIADHRRLRRRRRALRDQDHREGDRRRQPPEGDRPRRHRRRQYRRAGRHRQGHHRDEHAVRQFHHHRRARHRAAVRARAPDSAGRHCPPRPANGRRTASSASSSPPRRSASSAAAISARSSPSRALGLQMKVIAYDPYLSPERALDLGVEKVELDALFARADFISLHTPLTDKTRNIINAASLAKTRKGVRIINCARGGLVDEQALRAALDSGHVAGAALRRVLDRARDRQPLVRPPQRGVHAASRRRHQRGAGERGAAGRRADGRLPAARRDLERA